MSITESPNDCTFQNLKSNELNGVLGYLCARITFWGWWHKWDDTALQTQGSKFLPWRPEAEHATSRSRRLPQYLIFTVSGIKHFVSLKLECQSGVRVFDLRLSKQVALAYRRYVKMTRLIINFPCFVWDRHIHIHLITFSPSFYCKRNSSDLPGIVAHTISFEHNYIVSEIRTHYYICIYDQGRYNTTILFSLIW